MLTSRLLRLSSLALAAMAINANAGEHVPEQYRDDFVSIRAGIPDAGAKPVHLGDTLQFLVRVEFDPNRTRLEQFDERFFEIAFAELGSFRAGGPPRVTTTDMGGGKAQISALWHFQILDCPDQRNSCPGSKHYELPVMSVAYEITDGSGQVVNNQSARFQPWPGEVAVAPAISADRTGGSLTDIFPAGAYPAPQVFANRTGTGLFAMGAGGLALVIALTTGARRNRLPYQLKRDIPYRNRWEKLYQELEDDSMPDEHWADGLRRCFIWYCQDELRVNPCGWFEHGVLAKSKAGQPYDDWRILFFDILQQERIATSERKKFRARFGALTGLNAAPLPTESRA